MLMCVSPLDLSFPWVWHTKSHAVVIVDLRYATSPSYPVESMDAHVRAMTWTGVRLTCKKWISCTLAGRQNSFGLVEYMEIPICPCRSADNV